MQLPPAQVTRAVIQRYARIVHRYGNEFGRRPFVLPNGDYFPDEFLGDADSVMLLTSRMQEHAGLGDIPIECRVVTPDAPATQTSSCAAGSCGVPQSAGGGLPRLVDAGDSWTLHVPAPELRHPVALTTNLARSLSYVFLVETQREGELLEPPLDVTADFIAVGLGFGALMLQGSYIYAKSCGGPQIASVTKVGISELAVAVALFAFLGDHKLGPALKELDVTQRAALQEAGRLFKANKKLIDRMRTQPERVAVENFELSEPGVFLENVMKRLSRRPAPPKGLEDIHPNLDLDEVESLLIDMPPSSQAGRNRRPSPPSDDLSNLVAEALQAHHSRA